MNDPYIAAASGLVLMNSTFYIASDDELNIMLLSEKLDSTGLILPLFSGELPEEHKERKKIKPDIESILWLPDQKKVLALPSGTKPNRTLGALISEDQTVSEISFKSVYQHLEKIYSELNIEGAVVIKDKIRLFQRGNGQLHQNAIIDLNLSAFINDEVEDLMYKNIVVGDLNGIHLTFTDASFDEDLIWFLAVAENSESTFLDGDFSGAVLGKMDIKGTTIKTYPLDIPYKPEGLAVKERIFYVVTDADDRSIPSRLYQGTLP